MTLNLSTLYGNVGPANNDIANAVASNSNVAATIAANGGFGNTYTQLATASLSGISTTASWSGTYKRIIISVPGIYISASNVAVNIRFNGDSGTNYRGGMGNYSATYAAGNGSTSFTGLQTGTAGGNVTSYYLTFETPAATSSAKPFTISAFAGYVPVVATGNGAYLSSSALTSVTLLSNDGTSTFTAGSIYVYGAN